MLPSQSPPGKAPRPQIKADLKPKLLRLTSSFEGGWSALAGSADGQTLSFGPLQWNLGQGTLVPVLRRIQQLNGPKFNQAIGMEISDLLPNARALTEFAGANIFLADGTPKPSWKARFAALAALDTTEQVFLEAAREPLERAQELAERCEFRTERGLALCFDTATRLPASAADLEHEYRRGNPGRAMEYQRLQVLARAAAGLAAPGEWAAALERGLAIAAGHGRVGETSVNLQRFGIELSRSWYAD